MTRLSTSLLLVLAIARAAGAYPCEWPDCLPLSPEILPGEPDGVSLLVPKPCACNYLPIMVDAATQVADHGCFTTRCQVELAGFRAVGPGFDGRHPHKGDCWTGADYDGHTTYGACVTSVTVVATTSTTLGSTTTSTSTTSSTSTSSSSSSSTSTTVSTSTSTSASTSTSTSSSTSSSSTSTSSSSTSTSSTTLLVTAPDWTPFLLAVWRFDEANPATDDAVDATGNGHTLNNGNVGCTVDSSNVREGTRSFHASNCNRCGIGCPGSGGPCAPYDFTSGDFTAGCWVRPTANTSGAVIGNDGTNGGFGSGWMLWLTTTGHRFEFQIDGATYVATDSSATHTWAVNDWHHYVGRYTDSTNLAEQVIDGALDSVTGSTASPGAATTGFFGVGPCSGSSANMTGNIDECFIEDHKLTETDICRIAICNISGALCTCDYGGDPTAYLTRPRHSADGGSITCTMPACNKAAPE